MRLFTWLLVGAVLFRGLIPAGYMPQAGGEKHLFNIVICTAAGSQTITVDNHGQPVKNDNKGNQNHTGHKAPCLFAVHASALLSAHVTAPLMVLKGYAVPVFAAPASHPAMAVLRKTAPPRAPPLFS
jgi:hypothetical protein